MSSSNLSLTIASLFYLSLELGILFVFIWNLVLHLSLILKIQGSSFARNFHLVH